MTFITTFLRYELVEFWLKKSYSLTITINKDDSAKHYLINMPIGKKSFPPIELMPSEGLENLKYLFGKENVEKGNEAEKKVYEYLKMRYPVVVDFRFPLEFTDWMTKASKKLDDYTGLQWLGEIKGSKFDFIVRDSDEKVFFVDVKSPQEKWLTWGCGANKEQYDRYFGLTKLFPFYLYAWVREKRILYIHQVRDPNKPKLEVLGQNPSAYKIPANEIRQVEIEKSVA